MPDTDLSESLPPGLPVLPEKWDWRALSSFVSTDRGICYGIVQPGPYFDNGIPILRVENIENGQVSIENVYRVSPEVSKRHSRSLLRGGELLITLVGAYFGKVAVAPFSVAGFNTARAVGVVPVDADAQYLSLALRSPVVQGYLQSWATTTAQPTLNLADVARIPIPLPPANVRDEITNVIISLEKKLELNRRMNGLLEGMIGAIFKAWFIDFAPVKAKASGATSFAGMPQSLFDQLPNSFNNSELGDIPEGWIVRSVAELGSFVNGKAFTKHANEMGRMIIRIAELNSGPGASTKYSDVDAAIENTAFPDDILFAWSGSLDVYRWHREEAIINQHIFKVIPDHLPSWFVYYQLVKAMPEFRTIASTKATTMGHIKRGHLDQSFFAMPTAEFLHSAGEKIRPLYDLVHVNAKESFKLSAIRDTLLPKLIGGEIAVGGNDHD